MMQFIPASPNPITRLEYPHSKIADPLLESFATLRLGQQENLYQTGDSAETLYIVLEGLLKLSRVNHFGEERLVGLVGPGDVLGLGGLKQHFHSEDASTLTAVRVACLETSSLVPLTQKHPAMAQVLFGAMAQRAQDLLELLELSSAPVLVRMGQMLLWLGERFGELQPDGWYKLDLGLRQEDLASLIGVQRPTFTHCLSQLRDMGLIRGTRGIYQLNQKGLMGYLHRLSLAA